MEIFKKKIIPAAFLLSGIILMILGILRGELIEIMRKATVICLECIGIG